MKIAVVGTGVSGSYLVNRLSESHEVVGFERRPEDQFFAVCAWGTSKYEMRRLTASTGLDFDKYILWEGRDDARRLGDEMLDIPLDGLVTFNKHQFEVDLMKGREVRYGVRANKEELQKEGFDMIMDATGNHRELLPKVPNDAFIPCYETKMKYSGGPPIDELLRQAVRPRQRVPVVFPGEGVWLGGRRRVRQEAGGRMSTATTRSTRER